MNPGRGGYNRPQREEGPPQELTEVGEVMHGSEETSFFARRLLVEFLGIAKWFILRTKLKLELLMKCLDLSRTL